MLAYKIFKEYRTMCVCERERERERERWEYLSVFGNTSICCPLTNLVHHKKCQGCSPKSSYGNVPLYVAWNKRIRFRKLITLMSLSMQNLIFYLFSDLWNNSWLNWLMQKEAGIPKKAIKAEDIPGLSKFFLSLLFWSLAINILSLK